MDFDELLAELMKKIENRNERLKKHFRGQDYREMPKEFTPNTKILTHQGQYIPGHDSEDYWREVIVNLRGTDLDFKEPRLEAWPLPGKEDYEDDFVALEVTEFTFKANGQEYRGFIDPPSRHRVRCDWH